MALRSRRRMAAVPVRESQLAPASGKVVSKASWSISGEKHSETIRRKITTKTNYPNGSRNLRQVVDSPS